MLDYFIRAFYGDSMSDLITNWIRPGPFVIFHYFNRNWNCCDYEAPFITRISRERGIATHFDIRAVSELISNVILHGIY